MIADDLIRYSYGNASVLELAWTFLGVLGLGFTLVALRESHGDRRALRADAHYVKGGARDVIAKRNTRNLRERVAIFWAILLIGGIALLSAPPQTSGGPSPYAAVLSGSLMFIEVILVSGAFWDRRDLHELYFQIRLRRADGLPPEVMPVKDKRV